MSALLGEGNLNSRFLHRDCSNNNPACRRFQDPKRLSLAQPGRVRSVDPIRTVLAAHFLRASFASYCPKLMIMLLELQGGEATPKFLKIAGQRALPLASCAAGYL
jgi:hypothetical protein